MISPYFVRSDGRQKEMKIDFVTILNGLKLSNGKSDISKPDFVKNQL